MNEVVMQKFGVGAPVRRKEDPAFVTGRGSYVGDYTPEGTLYAAVVRSPYAHARFTVGDVSAAAEMPGVHLILTAANIAHLGPLPCKAGHKQPDGSRVEAPARTVLCLDETRHVGDPVALVVADSVNAAKSAGEMIEIDWEPLDVVTTMAAALEPDAVKVWPERADNVAFEFDLGSEADTDALFATAAKVARVDIVNNRVVTNYMETRGCVAEYDGERLTLTVGSQGVHSMQRILAKEVLNIPAEKLRVRTPDVGGGFGTKTFVFPEYPLCLVAAEKLGRPVKWICERSEAFLSDAQGRDNLSVAEVAMDAEGRFLALKIDTMADMGAYLSQYGPNIPWFGLSMATGVYDLPTVYVRVRGIYTHTVPTDAYRGAGRPEAAYLLERLVDKAAFETGLSVHEIRRRNFVRPEQMPYTTPAGRMYDTGDFAGHLDEALDVADWAGFEARAAKSRAKGLYRGIGLATYVEACAFAGSEPAKLQLEGDGSLTLLIGTMSNGQGHATAYGQVVAQYLGVDLDKITLVQGDTDRLEKGGGTGGSRSIPLGLPSVDMASQTLVKTIKDLASERLEASPADLELVDGAVHVVGTDQSISLADVAAGAADKDTLKAIGEFKQAEATYPNGTHICELEIDPQTGTTTFDRYTIVDDFGVTVNPLLLAGQVHGGVIQSIGQALFETTVYDEDGQLLTASFLDYAMPRAGDVPAIDFQTRNVPSTTNIMGIKGAGEAGTIGATPAVMNAVVDALRRGCGIDHIDMPATPARVWEAIQAAK